MVKSRVVERPSPGTTKPLAGPAYSTATASSQMTSRAVSLARPPTSQRTPAAHDQARMRWKLRRSGGSPPSATTAKRERPTWSVTKQAAKASPRSPNAPGSTAAMTRLTSMQHSNMARTTRLSGSNQLVIQAV